MFLVNVLTSVSRGLMRALGSLDILFRLAVHPGGTAPTPLTPPDPERLLVGQHPFVRLQPPERLADAARPWGRS